MPDITPITTFNALVAVRDHLRTELSLNERQCYIKLDPLTTHIPLGGDYWVTVSPTDGSFLQAEMEGSVRDQCVKNATVRICAFSRVHLDDADHDVASLGNATRGMMALEMSLIDKLAAAQLTHSSNPFLWEDIRPLFVRYQQLVATGDQGEDAGVEINCVIVDFSLVFQLALT